MKKTTCEYYPCHKKLDDCLFCYCPIFPCKINALGEWIKKDKKKIWDCSNCELIHNKDVIKEIKSKILFIIQLRVINEDNI